MVLLAYNHLYTKAQQQMATITTLKLEKRG